MNLSLELATFLNEFAMRVPLPRQRIIDRAVKALVASGFADRAPQVGDRAPDFSLSDDQGRPHTLRTMLQAGPVVLIFFRGVWCPFCNLMMRAYQERLADFAQLNIQLLAVSPQSAHMLQRTRTRNRLQFPLLSDPGCRVASDYGLVYTVDGELAELYGKVGHRLPEYNASGDWLLPMPAVFLIGQSGHIDLAQVEPDFRRRLNPEAVLKVFAERVPERLQ